MKRCLWHAGPILDDRAVMVATVPRTSGPDYPVYACSDCVRRLSIVPLADRHDGDESRPLLIGRRDGPPILPEPAAVTEPIGSPAP